MTHVKIDINRQLKIDLVDTINDYIIDLFPFIFIFIIILIFHKYFTDLQIVNNALYVFYLENNLERFSYV